jgi:predicted glycosyltransferase
LQAGCRSLVVPFSAGGETDSARAEQLARLGQRRRFPRPACRRLLCAAITNALAGPRPPRSVLNLDGAQGYKAAQDCWKAQNRTGKPKGSTRPISMKRVYFFIGSSPA